MITLSSIQPLDHGILFAVIRGCAFTDPNFGNGVNGVREDSEGTAGIVIELFSAGPNKRTGGGDDVRLGETTTGFDGSYAFIDLPAGTYILRLKNQQRPKGFVIGIQNFLDN